MELKPCPFCGGKASTLIKPFIGANGAGYVVECDSCWCSTGYYETEAEAIEAWNTRAGCATINMDDVRDIVECHSSYAGEGTGRIFNNGAYARIAEELNTRAERTGRIKEDETGFLVCSECGAIQPEEWVVYYCWSCGAKVVGE